MNTNQQYLLVLLKAALTRTAAPETPAGLDWAKFAAYAEEQQLEHIIYPLLKDADTSIIPTQVWH